MKAFLLSAVLYGLLVVATGFVTSQLFSYTAMEAFSATGADPRESGGEHRAGWQPIAP